MPDVTNSPEDKRRLVATIVDELSSVSGVVAVVLGGSFASGRATPESDVDLGIYYREASPFRIEHIRAIAERISGNSTPVVTDFYQWGPWVNGGAWIRTASGKVDFLYRNLDHVERTITDAENGIIEHHYGQQPPYGFYSVIYLAETKIAVPLHDPEGALTRAKARVARYPDRLRMRIVDDALWSAEFTLGFAESASSTGDVYGAAGCLTRIFSNLTQAIFALNEEFFLTDKRIGATLRSFRKLPRDYVARMERVLSAPGGDAAALSRTVQSTRQLWAEVVALSGGTYRSHYSM